MAQLHHGSRDSLRIGRSVWAGVGLVRGGAGTGFVGSAENIARALSEYQDAGVEICILSGYPHLEEAYCTAELLFPAIGKASPVFQTVQQAVETSIARAGSRPLGVSAQSEARYAIFSALCDESIRRLQLNERRLDAR
jgi:hypothetical protein